MALNPAHEPSRSESVPDAKRVRQQAPAVIVAAIGLALSLATFAAWRWPASPRLRSEQAWGVLVLGLALTASLGAFLRRERARRAALDRELAAQAAAHRDDRRRLQDIAETSTNWLWETDRSHRFTTLAGGGLRALPLRTESFIGRTRREIAADNSADEAWASHWAALEAHLPFRDFRYRVRTPGGDVLYIAASGKPVFDAGNNFLGYRGTAVDETANVEAARRAAEAENLLWEAIESNSGGVIICDPNDRIVLSNRYVQDRFPECAAILRGEGTYQDYVRRVVAHGYYPDALGREEDWIAERMATHRAAAGGTEYRQRDGRWLLATERRMKDGGIAIIGVDITRIKRTQTALAASEERLNRAQSIARIGSWEIDVATAQLTWSKEMYRLHGLSEHEFRPTPADLAKFVPAEDMARLQLWFGELAAGRQPEAIEFRLIRSDGAMRTAIFEGTAVRDESGRVQKTAGTLRDVTEQRATERQLIQAQKMEAIGTLTGGLAHDFNNLMGIIIGNLDMLRDLVTGSEAQELTADALEAAMRGADLTRRLLAFARRQPLHPQRVAANDIIGDITRLLSRILGEQIEIKLDLAPDLWPINVDAAQFEAAITNIATNARDAMPNGGRLTIATRNDRLDEEYVGRHADVAPGDYIVVRITDTGQGMPPDIVSHIFEPFFTTKEPGKGTGLGLSMVFGFMRQSGGYINVYSEPGHGTTFRLYLPRNLAGAAPERPATAVEHDRGSGEAILVVEDNRKLLAVVVKQLAGLGYRAVAVTEPAEALAIVGGEEPVDILFTDIVMPGGMSGIELARDAVAQRPNLKVILTSGFPGDRLGEDLARHSGWRLLSKPYRKEELARLVRETLDCQASGPDGGRSRQDG